jgi:transposase
MHERFAQRIVDGLEPLGRRLEKARKPVDRSQVERQIGRLLQRNSRAAGKFRIRVEERADCPSGLRLIWSENRKWSEWASLTEGAYVLRSNVADWTPEELWRTYIQLHQAEAAFRIQKSELTIRPIWHQKEARVKAHILVCFLAFALWKALEGWQKRAGLGSSPRTILQEMARINCVDVVLPLKTGKPMRLRCVVKPEAATAILVDRLGLRLPRRLEPPELPDEM